MDSCGSCRFDGLKGMFPCSLITIHYYDYDRSLIAPASLIISALGYIAYFIQDQNAAHCWEMILDSWA